MGLKLGDKIRRRGNYGPVKTPKNSDEKSEFFRGAVLSGNNLGLIVETSDCCNAPIKEKGKGLIVKYCSGCGQNYEEILYR